jgi:hypothetical protein
MHELTDRYREQYLSSSKRQKGSLVRAVIRQIEATGGRFLKLQSSRCGTASQKRPPPLGPAVGTSASANRNFLLEAVDEETAYKKVSHCFRSHRRGRVEGSDPVNLRRTAGSGDENSDSSDDDERKPAAIDVSQSRFQSQGMHPEMSFPQVSQLGTAAATPVEISALSALVAAASTPTLSQHGTGQVSGRIDPYLAASLLAQADESSNALTRTNALLAFAAGAALGSSAALSTGQQRQNPSQQLKQTLQSIYAQQQPQRQIIPPQLLLQNALLSELAQHQLQLQHQHRPFSQPTNATTVTSTADVLLGNMLAGPMGTSQQMQPQNLQSMLLALAQQVHNNNPSTSNEQAFHATVHAQQEQLLAPSASSATQLAAAILVVNNLLGVNPQQPAVPLSANAGPATAGPQVGMTLAMNRLVLSLLQQQMTTGSHDGIAIHGHGDTNGDEGSDDSGQEM